MILSQGFSARVLCIVLCGFVVPLANAKPLSPVQVSITPSQSASQGQPVEFLVRATVTVDTENLQIVVSIPQALNLISGQLQWQGPLLKGREMQLRFTASLPPSANTMDETLLIQVRAAILAAALETDVQDREKTRLAASAFYRWPTSAAKAVASQSLPLNSRVVERNGLKIQEYEVVP